MSFQRVYRRMRFGPPIVVVSGLPRSGTSMTMRMLVAGGMQAVTDGRRAADEDNPTGYFEEEKVKDLALDPDKGWLRRARGKAVKIVSSLLQHLPDSNNYKVLFMHRDLHEVLASQSKMLQHRGESSDTGDDRMLELFRGHLASVQAMLRTRPCFEVHEIEYAAVVQDARGQAERIQSFLRLRLDVGAMAGAVEPQLYRNRR